MTDDGRITSDAIRRLPRWARVAFAARCARRAQPIYQHFWPDAPEHHLRALDRAVRVAEQAAANAGPGVAAEAADAAYAAASEAARGAPRDAADATYAAARAAHAAMAAGHADTTDAAYAAADAGLAAGQIAAVRQDFDTLLHLATNQRWTDDTPVPPSAFGPMWPDGPPKGWPVDEFSKLVLKVTAPANIPPAELEADLVELYTAMNDWHIARGGSGLSVEDFKKYVAAGVLQPTQGD